MFRKESFRFRNDNPHCKREDIYNKIHGSYPGRVPIIIEVYSKDQIVLVKNKYLTPVDISVGKFMAEIRKNVQGLTPERALFLLMENKTLPPISETIGSLYDKHKHSDGFLYLYLCDENVFGVQSEM